MSNCGGEVHVKLNLPYSLVTAILIGRCNKLCDF